MLKILLSKSLFPNRDKPAHLILHVTNKCNLRCNTCFVNFDIPIADISLEEIKKVSKSLGKLLWLDLSGGEPFLRKDLPEICSSFKSEVITIPTNGFDSELIYEKTKEILDTTKAELTVSISLDGFKEVHDSIRAKGSFDKAIATLKKLRTIPHLKVKVNTVLCEKNYPTLIQFMKYIKTFNPDFHSIILLRGNPRNKTYKLPSLEKLIGIRKGIFSMWDSYSYGLNPIISRILKNYQKQMYNTSLNIIKKKRQIPSCLAGTQHLVIYANGDVSFCEMLPSMGNLKNKPLKAILNSEPAKRLRKHIAQKKCYCHHNCNILDNYFLNWTKYPKLILGD